MNAGSAAEGLVEEDLRAATDERVGGLEIVGDGAGDRVEGLARLFAEEPLLEEATRADRDARCARELVVTGDDDEVEIEVDVAAERDVVDGDAVRLASADARRRAGTEGSHLEEGVTGLGPERSAGTRDVLHEVEVEGRAGRGDVKRRAHLAVHEVEEELAAGRLPSGIRNRRKLFRREPGMEAVAHRQVLIESEVDEVLLEEGISIGEPVFGDRRFAVRCDVFRSMSVALHRLGSARREERGRRQHRRPSPGSLRPCHT